MTGKKSPQDTTEYAIGAFVLGFVGDPEALADEDKWAFYDALVHGGDILGDVIDEIWCASLIDASDPDHERGI